MDKRIFIVFDQNDREVAKEFCDKLNRLCRLDVELPSECSLTAYVKELISKSVLVIFLLTETSGSSQDVYELLKYASDLNKRFLPVNMENGLTGALRAAKISYKINFRTNFLNYNDEDGFIGIFRVLTSLLGLVSNDILGDVVGVEVNFTTSHDCRLYLNGAYRLTVKAGTVCVIRIVWGKHVLKFVYTRDDDCFIVDTIHLKRDLEVFDYNIVLDKVYRTKRQYARGTYEGEAKLGMRHGKGVMIFYGSSYSGEWQEDTMHGEGTFKFGEKEHYKGTFNYGYCEGKGKYVGLDYNYTGQWKGGLKEGNGSTKYNGNGISYNGEYHNSKYEGKGELSFSVNPFNKKYKGEFLKGLPHGKGKMIYSDYGTYDGDWISGKLEGKGTIEYPNGDKYVGEFVGGKKNGKGTYTFNNGESYAGNWENDEPKGYGVYTWLNGYCFKGTFNGYSMIYGQLYDSNNKVVDSTFKSISDN